MADREAAKQLILKIVAMAGGRLEAMSRLNKAFYAAHLIYWQERQGVLSDYPVVKLPHGPAIDDFDGLVAELVGEGALEVHDELIGPYPTTVLTLKTSVQIDPKAPEFDPIQRAVRWVKRHTVAELERLTHDRPSYLAQPRVGYEQPIYLDAIKEEEYAKVKASCAEVDEAFRAALGA
jgi:hypothetical protein